MKYPIGIQTFDHIIEDGFVYVDKTEMVYALASEDKYYLLTRPRRFGKSLLLSTLKAYFEGKKGLFQNLQIEALEKDWTSHKVFLIDFNGVDFTIPGSLEACLGGYLEDWEKAYGISPNVDATFGSRFEVILQKAADFTQRGVVVLVDEYDKPWVDLLEGDKALFNKNLATLNAFYAALQLGEASLRFVMLTGVTNSESTHVCASLNQLRDISTDKKYDTLCGFTQEEIDEQFAEPIHELAKSLTCSTKEARDQLRKTYGGYRFSERLKALYNPFSILNAFFAMELRDYWFSTGMPSYLIRLMNHCHQTIDELTSKSYPLEAFIRYKAGVEYPLPLIYQSGYLTIKSCDKRRKTFLLDFPNNEVKNGFLTMVAANYLKTKTDVRNVAQDLAFALEDGEVSYFRKALTAFLASIPYSMRRKSDEAERERYFQYTFYLLLRLMSVYTVFVEKEQSEGRVDCIVETPKLVYVFEFKLDGTADQAIKQIDEKGYTRPYEADKRDLFKIGVSFSSSTGTIMDWKEIKVR